jgi:hypothetical protein
MTAALRDINDFTTALAGILIGEGADELSAANIVRLKKVWEKDYQQWRNRKKKF